MCTDKSKEQKRKQDCLKIRASCQLQNRGISSFRKEDLKKLYEWGLIAHEAYGREIIKRNSVKVTEEPPKQIAVEPIPVSNRERRCVSQQRTTRNNNLALTQDTLDTLALKKTDSAHLVKSTVRRNSVTHQSETTGTTVYPQSSLEQANQFLKTLCNNPSQVNSVDFRSISLCKSRPGTEESKFNRIRVRLRSETPPIVVTAKQTT